MKKILVLPGTVWQLPLIKKIKAMGHEIHLVNPVKVEEVCEYADYFFQADIFNSEAIIDYCKKNGIDVVMSEECDIATDVVAKYNRKIGARHLTSEMAQLFTNKLKMREFCEENDINPIPYKRCNSIDEAIAFFTKYGKSVMKPIDSNASHGVFTIEKADDIKEKFKETISFSRNIDAVLIEKYIEGTEFTVDGIMTSHGHETLAISEKEHYAHNSNIANSLFFSQFNSKFDYELLRNTNNRLLNLTQLPYGITHVEYKFCQGKYYLIEMAARGGGNLISAIIAPFMSGVDSYNELINSCLNERYSVEARADVYNDKTAILKFLDLPCSGGIVDRIRGEEYLKNEGCIKSYGLNFNIGDYVHQPESDSVRIGYYIICSNSKDEFDKVTTNINKNFEIVLR